MLLRHVLRLIMIPVLGLTLHSTAAQACTGEQVTEAIFSTGRLANRIRKHSQAEPFKAVKAVFKTFQGCEDGAPGEGMSDVVVASLVNYWANVSDLFHLMDSDAAFGAFVIRHVDASCDTDELKTVFESSQKRCPRGYREHCEQIHAAALEALQMTERATGKPVVPR